MLDGKFEALPPNAWKPFGNGMRGCIGRPFAWQESLLVVATVSETFCGRYAELIIALPKLRFPASRRQLPTGDQNLSDDQARSLVHARITEKGREASRGTV